MTKKTLKDVDLKGRKLLMRVDFNVPLSKDGFVADDTRIKAALPSIDYAARKGASVVLLSHLGRPKGKIDPASSLKVVAHHLAELTNYPVKFIDDCVGAKVESKVASLNPGEILLLENVRFYPEETENSPEFSEQLSRIGDLYANDAFGTAHRSHSSTEGVTRYFGEKVAGFLMEKELDILGGLLDKPQRPFVAILGGAKVSTKIGVVRNLLERVDRILIGGGMAFTFFKAAGLDIGNSLVDDEFVPLCRELMETSSREGTKRIFLPVDIIVAENMDNDAAHRQVSVGDIPEDWLGVDIGVKTLDLFAKELENARTIFWNGPMGVFEMPNFAEGTKRIARMVADATERGASTIIGGGDSVAAVNSMNLTDKVTHISTGGGAALEYLEGRELPGVAVLSDRDVSMRV